MRKEFAESVERLAPKDSSVVFITGDLGYAALEGLQLQMGSRFINAGVAEQNMIGVAAGLAYKGFKVFCYSIAPFIVYRCLEQFRNDVCMHHLPVFLVGNGGGYGYGIMGATHHALEDIGCMGSMQNANCWVPAFANEVGPMVQKIISDGAPAYLRLNSSTAMSKEISLHESFSLIQQSNNPKVTIVGAGPVINNAISAVKSLGISDKVDIFNAQKFPLFLTDELVKSVKMSRKLLTVEEHVSTGGLGEQLAKKILERSVVPDVYKSLHAQGYPDGLYGDQSFHQKRSGLDPESIASQIKQIV